MDIYEWLDKMEEDDEDYQQFQKECAVLVSPKTGRKIEKGWKGF